MTSLGPRNSMQGQNLQFQIQNFQVSSFKSWLQITIRTTSGHKLEDISYRLADIYGCNVVDRPTQLIHIGISIC